MESRKSKKTRSYGEASRSSRDTRSSLSSPSATSRPHLKDRVKSAPLVAQTPKTRQEPQSKHASTSVRVVTRAATQDVGSPPLTPESPISPKPNQEEKLPTTLNASGQVRTRYLLILALFV